MGRLLLRAEEHCISDDTPNEIATDPLKQMYTLTHSLPFQSRVGEQECLGFCLQEKRIVVLGCVYIQAGDGQSATCEAIVNKPGERHTVIELQEDPRVEA